MSSPQENESSEGGRRPEHYHGGIYEEIPFGVWTCRPDGGLRYASDSFLELLDMSMDQASGFGWTERIAQDDRDSIQRWRQCVADEQDWDDEHRIRDQQGNVRTLLARGLPVQNDHGEVDYWIGVHLDITERKQAEKRVEDARKFAEAVIETAPDPLVVLDEDHRVVAANPAFYRRFASQPASTEEHLLHEVGNGQWDIPELHRLLDEALQENDSFDDYEVEHDFPRIGRKVMLISGRRLPRKVSPSELVVLVIRDVTELRQKEDRLRIAQETQAVQQERDRLAHRLHDHIQQLLHAANLHIALVRAEEQDEEKQQALTKVDDLLQEAGHAARDLAVELVPPVLLDSGLMPALEWLAEWVESKYQLRVDLEIEPDVRLKDQNICLLLFDVVRELLLNVVKHAGTGSTNVSAGRQGDHWLQIVVQDTGAGAESHQVESNEDLAGGFGLASIRRRLESVGGVFHFDSTPGKGTTVTVSVPFRQA